MSYLVHWLIVTIAILIAARIVPGLRVSGWGSALLGALVLGALNVVVKPILIFLTFPLTILTLGLFLLVVNAAVLGLVGYIVPGFRVRGFWAAVFGAIAISLCTYIADALVDHAFDRPQNPSQLYL